MSSATALQPGRFYHLYNRGINGENLFRDDHNYAYFLKLYAEHVGPVADTYAYCLLKNHFHLLVRIKETSQAPSQAFANLFNAYGKSINKAYGRTGSLFQHPFGRSQIDSDAYFCRVVCYIHQNPQRHGFVKDFQDWKFSSYHALLSDRPTQLERDEVMRWFNNREQLIVAHTTPVSEHQIAKFVGDDVD